MENRIQKILFISFLLLSNLTFSQSEESKTDSLTFKIVTELKTIGINDFFFIKRYCVGADKIIDLSENSDCINNKIVYETYIFWQFKNQNWIRKIDDCGVYEPVKMTNSTIIDIFKNNEEDISNENIRKYTTNKNEQIFVNHSCFRLFHFYTKTKDFQKSFDLFDLTNNSKQNNINYDSNERLKLTELNKICDKTIENLEKTKQFKR